MDDSRAVASDPRALPPGEPSTIPATATSTRPLTGREPTRLYDLANNEAPHFWDYWAVLLRHRWTVTAVFLVVIMAAMVQTFTTRPIYTAKATLRLEIEEPRVVKFEEVVRTDPQPDYYQTQYKLLQSRALAHRVIGLLELDQHPEFAAPKAEMGWATRAQAWAREHLVHWMPLPPPPMAEGTDDLILESPLTRAFLGRLAVEPLRNTRLVEVSFQSHYPDLAARVVNTVTEAFIAQQVEQRIEATRYATQFLAKQIEEARGKLEESESALTQFLRANNILFVVPDSHEGRPQDLITQQLTILSDALLKGRAERINKESQFRQAMSQEAGSTPAVLQSELVAKLKEEQATLEGEFRRLKLTFKPDYPKVQRLNESIGEVRRQIQSEVKRVVDALKAEYQAAVRNETEMEKALLEQQGQVRQLDAQMGQYNLLRREVDTNRDLHNTLLNRLRETQISSALLTSNISIVDRAEVPGQPSKPRKMLNLLLASVVGLIGGIGLAFVWEYLDTNLKDMREVETILHVPTLGLVPSSQAMETRRSRRLRLASNGASRSAFALVAYADVGSVLAEAFRNLRTSLLYSSPEHPPKTFLVTSLQSEDGKTSLATNLAITLAQLGAGDILLVDGDMRHPNVHDIFSLPQAPGLSTFLTGQAVLPEILQSTAIPNLHVIPAGRVPLNPAELMASKRLGQALEALGGRFAHIVFDTPPLFGVSDALILSPRVDGVVLVLRQGRASRDAAQHATRLLTSVHARVLGVVLNDVRSGGTGYHYGYYGYYGYGYGHTRNGNATI